MMPSTQAISKSKLEMIYTTLQVVAYEVSLMKAKLTGAVLGLIVLVGLVSMMPAAYAKQDQPIGGIIEPLSTLTSSIRQGSTNIHLYDVSSSIGGLHIRLEWYNTDSSLILIAVRPDGSLHNFYRDSSDGSVNGVIEVVITYPQQDVWKFYVYGENVSGLQSYMLTITEIV